jgi:hypothetical protein
VPIAAVTGNVFAACPKRWRERAYWEMAQLVLSAGCSLSFSSLEKLALAWERGDEMKEKQSEPAAEHTQK